MDEKKQINMTIADGHEFWAHELSINFNPTQFIFDFKCITPRIDPRSQRSPTLLLRHNIVMTDIYHAKLIHELLGNVLKKYEEEHGKIKKPEAIEKIEKKRKKEEGQNKKKVESTKNSTPSYLG